MRKSDLAEEAQDTTGNSQHLEQRGEIVVGND